jgi:hypothetical protein
MPADQKNKKPVHRGVKYIKQEFVPLGTKQKLQKIDKNPAVSPQDGITVQVQGRANHIRKGTDKAFPRFIPGNGKAHIGKIVPPIGGKDVKKKKHRRRKDVQCGVKNEYPGF